MGRTKGSTNKQDGHLPHYSALPAEERIEFLAKLIVDRIIEDQQSDSKQLQKQVDKTGWKYVRATTV